MGRVNELLNRIRIDDGLTPEERRAKAEAEAEAKAEIKVADALLSRAGALVCLNMEHHGAWEGQSKFTVGNHVIDAVSGEHRVEAVVKLTDVPIVEIAVGVTSPTTSPMFFVRLDGKTILKAHPTEEGISERLREGILRGTQRAINSGLLNVRLI